MLPTTPIRPKNEPRRAVVIGLALPGQPGFVVDEHLDELEELAASDGVEVVARVTQSRRRPDPKTFIGRGKASEIQEARSTLGADLVIFDDDLSPSQIKNLEKIFDCQVIDRSALILDIFVQRARTREARTQVELAQLEYSLPRLTRQWTHLSRQAGGIGVRGGEGEKQLEADRRMLRTKIKGLKKQLQKIEKTREVQRRGRRGSPMVALAGYTNAGKSTLFNRLTKADVRAEDRLFATLDSRLRSGVIGDVGGDGDGVGTADGRDGADGGKSGGTGYGPGPADRRDGADGGEGRAAGHGPGTAIFSDTVGFIRKLPHHLVASFKSTLEEIARADLVLHVIDRSHPRWHEQKEVADEVLADLGVEETQILEVYNKSDLLPPETTGNGTEMWVSAKEGTGIPDLRAKIATRLPSPLP